MPEVGVTAKAKVTKKLSKKWRKSHKQRYSTYVCRALIQVHPSTGISFKDMSVMKSFIFDILERIASKASHLIHCNKCRTISGRVIQSAVRLLLPVELAKHAVSEGTKAVSKYTNSI
ncbi:histone H2B-like [Carcharodon carcharias]|uniref:histone H2B-like n=1 Tax=Carcharodon carcharias TaxID=13397 RepID=UPI001B7F2375|nr:histone H2B-like [Carcharodon carcharias]